MKVVIDANIIISFLLTREPTISKILQNWKENRLILLISNEVLIEIENVLLRFTKKGLIQSNEAKALIRRIKRKAVKVQVSSQITLSPDKKDNRYLALAKDGMADYLITGDKKHLLNLKKIGSVKIISPSQFLIENQAMLN